MWWSQKSGYIRIWYWLDQKGKECTYIDPKHTLFCIMWLFDIIKILIALRVFFIFLCYCCEAEKNRLFSFKFNIFTFMMIMKPRNDKCVKVSSPSIRKFRFTCLPLRIYGCLYVHSIMEKQKEEKKKTLGKWYALY